MFISWLTTFLNHGVNVKAQAGFIRRFALALSLTALGVAIAPLYIPIPPTKAFPGQHFINVIAGVMLGPIWATFVAILISIIRVSLGIGTIYAFPGSIPGALLVGLTAYILRKNGRSPEYAAFVEPIGTAIIGFLLALYLFAPLVGDVAKWQAALTIIWLGWLFSTGIGTLIGFAALKAIKSAGYL